MGAHVFLPATFLQVKQVREEERMDGGRIDEGIITQIPSLGTAEQ